MKNRTAAAIIAFILLLFILLHISGVFSWKCPFYDFFSLQCCGCGMTRAVTALFKGEFKEAFILHPFSFILVPFFIIWVIIIFLKVKTRETIINKIEIFEKKTGFLFIIILLFIVFGLARLIFQIYDLNNV